MKIFILEDDESRIIAFHHAIGIGHHDITTCRWLSGKQGAFKLFKPPYDIILLDHDLGGQQMVDSDLEETGFQFTKWMCKFEPSGVVLVHSYNPDGAKRMASQLHNAGWNVQLQPFGLTILNYLSSLRKDKVEAKS